jgi:hypothetical protein
MTIGIVNSIIQIVNMIIKTSLLWQTAQGKKIGLFIGYYDMTEDWSAISKVYFDFSQLATLVREVARLTSPPVRLLRDGNVVTIVQGGTASELGVETVDIDGAPHTFYAFPASLTPHTVWINWDRTEDTTQYGWNELYGALVLALAKGMVAGLAGRSTVDGLSPQEWAWQFVTRAGGSRSLSGEPIDAFTKD